MLDLCRDAGSFSEKIDLVIRLVITRGYLLSSSKGEFRKAIERKQTACKEEHGRACLKAKEKTTAREMEHFTPDHVFGSRWVWEAVESLGSMFEEQTEVYLMWNFIKGRTCETY